MMNLYQTMKQIRIRKLHRRTQHIMIPFEFLSGIHSMFLANKADIK